ncbi:hypothetical protein, partial [Streptococcus sp. SS-4456]|uniref:hypothetical protein n=1 Tax=Streptococcus sp. SS-4456 TaxID=3072286 RepID=UPI002FC9C32B
IIGHMGLFFYTQKGSIISTVDLPTTEIIEPIFREPNGSFSFPVIIFSALSCYTLSSFRKSTLDFFLGGWGRSHHVFLSSADQPVRFGFSWRLDFRLLWTQ